MTHKTIIDEVNKYFDIDISTRTRKRPFVYARVVYVMLARELFPKSTLVYTGELVGIDHASVIHANTVIRDTITRYEPRYFSAYQEIKTKLLVSEDVDAKVYNYELKSLIVDYEKLKSEHEDLKKSVDDRLITIMNSIKTVPEDKMDLFKLKLNAMITMIKA